MENLTNFSRASSLTSESCQGQNSNKIFMSVEEEESWRKDRRKKDNHNVSKCSLLTVKLTSRITRTHLTVKLTTRITRTRLTVKLTSRIRRTYLTVKLTSRITKMHLTVKLTTCLTSIRVPLLTPKLSKFVTVSTFCKIIKFHVVSAAAIFQLYG